MAAAPAAIVTTVGYREQPPWMPSERHPGPRVGRELRV